MCSCEKLEVWGGDVLVVTEAGGLSITGSSAVSAEQISAARVLLKGYSGQTHRSAPTGVFLCFSPSFLRRQESIL